MTEEGVNDAPFFKQDHVGLAIGITCIKVSISASGMILSDDNFSTIVKVVEEGQSIYINMNVFIRYLILSNIGKVLSIFLLPCWVFPRVLTQYTFLGKFGQ